MTASAAAPAGSAAADRSSARGSRPRAAAGSLRKLGRGEQALVAGHLLRLAAEDRRMRFCGRVDDAYVVRFATAQQVPAAVRIGYFEGGWMRGCAELHLLSRSWLVSRAELALSVEGAWQRRGIGTRLTDEALVLARNRAVDAVQMQWLAENAPMHALARAFHARVTMRHGEAVGVVFTPWPSPYTLAREGLTDGCAAISRFLAAGARAGAAAV